MIAASRRRSLPRPHLPVRLRLRRPGLRSVAAVAIVLALLGGGFAWFRQSSLVAVRQVTIVGVSGPGADQIRSALRGAARGMSTMDLDVSRLHAAVAPYPVVRALHLVTHFPHALRIDVTEQVPVAVLQVGGQRTTVAADGTLLPDVATSGALPTIAVAVAPGGTEVTGAARTELALLAAAPYPLLAKIASAGQAAGRGLTVTLRDGPAVYFGADSELAAKWSAVLAVLANSTSAGADYIDVSDPARPAAGTGSDTASAPASVTSPTAAPDSSETDALGSTAAAPAQTTVPTGNPTGG